jgi:DNA-binding NtrC family response regulator
MPNVADNVVTKINNNGSGENLASDSWHSAGQIGEVAAAIEPPVLNFSLRSFRDEAEIRAISSALTRTSWNRKRAAKLLSISYRGLLLKIRRHNITPASGNGRTTSSAAAPKVD